MSGRGEDHERLDGAVAVLDDQEGLRNIDRAIAQLEATRATLLRDERPDEKPEPDRSSDSPSAGLDRSDDESWGR
jgi:hypothetical protein